MGTGITSWHPTMALFDPPTARLRNPTARRVWRAGDRCDGRQTLGPPPSACTTQPYAEDRSPCFM